MSADLDILGLCGTTLKDTFTIDRAFTRGGFGLIYRGRHLTLRKEIAIKVFCPVNDHEQALEQEAISLFFQEIQILSTLEHPAIVKPYDCGTLHLPDRGDVPWMVLEWIEGRTLSQILREEPGRTWSPQEVLELLRPVLEALAEAHSHRIAHRDIAPGNIIVSESGTTQRLRLIDFGIARIRSSYETTAPPVNEPTGSILIAHSPRYPAPEQVLQHRTDTWTDVHALGLIIYHLITGRLPYPNSIFDPEHGACALRRPTPGLVGIDVGAWEPVLSRAVAINPRDRFPTAKELLEALESTLAAAIPAQDEFEVALPENWRVIEVAPSTVPILLNTPEVTVILHTISLTNDDLRHGFEIPITAGLACKLVLQRYAEVSLALTVVGHPGERPGLYSNAKGVGSRLTRAMLDSGVEKIVYCGQRAFGLKEILCYAAQAHSAAELSINVTRLNLTVFFATPIHDFVILQLNDPVLPQAHLVCIGIL